MKLKRFVVFDVFDDGFRLDDDGEWCKSEDVAALEAENETLREQLANTERMLLWLRNHYELFNCDQKDAEILRGRVIARVDKIIPNDGSEPDYSDIPYKGALL